MQIHFISRLRESKRERESMENEKLSIVLTSINEVSCSEEEKGKA
jgi:hypothetical protein